MIGVEREPKIRSRRRRDRSSERVHALRRSSVRGSGVSDTPKVRAANELPLSPVLHVAAVAHCGRPVGW